MRTLIFILLLSLSQFAYAEIYYLTIDTTISNTAKQKIRDEAREEFSKTRPRNVLSVANCPLHNEAYVKIVTDGNEPYLKQKVKAAMDKGWIKSVHRTNDSFIGKLRECWEAMESE